MVAWCWRAAGSPDPNQALIINEDGSAMDATAAEAVRTSGSIVPDKISANRQNGFSIVKYRGNGSNGATVPHGLNQTPDISIIKNLDSSTDSWWVSGYPKLSAFSSYNKFLILNEPYGVGTAGSNGSTNGPNVITLNTAGSNVGGNNVEYIVYCWHSVAGYSKFGSFIPINNGADSTFVHLGFKPAFIMLKQTTGGTWGGYQSWLMLDNARKTYNPQTFDSALWANMSVTEGNRGNGSSGNGGDLIDFLSNGFKIKADTAEISGGNTGPTIYMAFAEQPFSGPSNAR
jgi:hypothetical protein